MGNPSDIINSFDSDAPAQSFVRNMMAHTVCVPKGSLCAVPYLAWELPLPGAA